MFIKMASKRVSRCNFPIFLILLSGATIIYASDDSAPYSPSVDTVPYHRIYANEDISHTAGDGTQTVNLSHWYNDSIRGENARILHTAPDDTDLVVMRQLVGASSYIVKTTIVDSNAAVVFKVDTSLGRPPRHASAIYLCAMAFNVTNKYIDPAYPYSRADSIVAWVNVFFSNENSDTSLQIPLKFLKDIRNAMYINIVPGVAWTPVNTPTNPNSVQIDKMGSRYLDLLKIPFDSTFVNYKIDSVRIEVPRIYYTAYGAKYYGGIHVHGISFDTDYEIEPLLHFVQGDKRWKDTLINNLPGKRIGNRGCAITSCAMLLNKMGIVVPVTGDSVTPLNLLKWLEKNNGLDGADLIWGAISAFSQKSYEENPNQPSMLFTGHQITDVDSIENYLSSGIPVITRVKRRASTVGEHFVLSKGIGKEDSPVDDRLHGTYLLADPALDTATLLRYMQNGGTDSSTSNPPNRFISTQLFYPIRGDTVLDRSWLQISVHSPAELLITDGLGRRLGKDSFGTEYSEIPRGNYRPADAVGDPEDPTDIVDTTGKTAVILTTLEGVYNIDVFGTGSGAYKLSIAYAGKDNDTVISKTYMDSIHLGEVKHHSVFVAKEPVVPPEYIYVDDQGSDETGDGSVEKPFKTIGKAVQELPSEPLNSYIISIFPGKYNEHVELKNQSRIWTSINGLSFKPRYEPVDSMPQWCGAPGDFLECLMIEKEDFITVEGIMFQASSKFSMTKQAILIQNDADNITVKRCYFSSEHKNKLWTGVELGYDADSATIENCIFFGLVDGAIKNSNRIRPQSVTQIVNNTFFKCGYAVSFLGGGSGSGNPGEGFIFANNIVMNPSRGFAFMGPVPKSSYTITVCNSVFYGLFKEIVPVGMMKCYNFMDTLMRDPELALTDQVNFCNPDFMKPTSEAVLSGGLNINITPSVDFFGKQRDIPITIGAVEGAQCIAKRNMGGSPQSIKPDLPAVYKLNQNYPNPFLNYTTIRYQIPGTNKVDVRIDIISIDGKLIKTLVNDNRVPGYYTVTWDGLGNNQRRVPSGNYLYILRSGKFKDIKLITILK